MLDRSWQGLTLVLLLAACAAPATVRLDPAANVREARRLLAEAAAVGPVPVTVRGTAPLGTAQLLAAVEAGVRGLAIETVAAPEPGTGPRFVLDFTGMGGRLCGDPAEAEGLPDAGRVRAAFCADERAVALATAERSGAPERLVWRLVGAIVPDDYPDTYGFDLFGNRVGIGGGFSF